MGTRGITVNNIQPGPIDTDLNPAAGDWALTTEGPTALGRYGSVEEVAALVAFVASPEGVIHHRRKPDHRRRHKRVNQRTYDSAAFNCTITRNGRSIRMAAELIKKKWVVLVPDGVRNKRSSDYEQCQGQDARRSG